MSATAPTSGSVVGDDRSKNASVSLAFPTGPIAREISDRVFILVSEKLAVEQSPWMTKAEAIAYTRLTPSTFAKWSADGRIPSHGDRAKLYHRDELDKALRAL